MLAYVLWNVCGERSETRRVRGVTVTTLRLSRRRGEPAFLFRLRLRRMARRLVRQGVRLCVFGGDFPYADIFFAAGLRAPDLVRFRRALIVPLTEAALGALSLRARDTTLAVWGGTLDAQTEEALTALCRRVRHLALDMRGADGFCRRMQYRFGVSVQRVPLPARSTMAQLALALEAREGAANCPVVPLYEGAEEAFTVACRAPQGVLSLAASEEDVELLCAALWGLHALRASDVAITHAAFSKLDKPMQKQYNI